MSTLASESAASSRASARQHSVERMQAGAQRRRDAIARATADLERALGPYRAAADEVLSLMVTGPKDAEHAARRRMWAAHPPVAAARRALSEAEAKRR